MPRTEAENNEGNMTFDDYVVEFIALLDVWFWKIENKVIALPNRTGKRYDEETCNKLIIYIDDFIKNEVVSHPQYWKNEGAKSKGVDIDTPADFNRLEGISREAFAQEVYTLKEKYKDIEETIYYDDCFY